MRGMDTVTRTLFEDPFPAYVALGLAAAVLGGLWYGSRRPGLLLAVACAVLLGAGVYAAERWVVTDRERIHGILAEVTEGVSAGRFEVIEDHLDEDFRIYDVHVGRGLKAKAVTLAVAAAVKRYDVTEVRLIGDPKDDLTVRDDYAEGVVRAGVYRGESQRPILLAWRIEWVRRDGAWTLRRAERAGDTIP